MPEQILIDGNNLLHAMRAHAPIPLVGRETMVKVIERWAKSGDDVVTLYLDGAPPPGAMAKQMTSARIEVRFSRGKSADDLIVEAVHRANDPNGVRVVSGDTAIVHEAKRRGCRCTAPIDFIYELFPPTRRTDSAAPAPPPREKPRDVSPQEARELEARISDLVNELFDGVEWTDQ